MNKKLNAVAVVLMVGAFALVVVGRVYALDLSGSAVGGISVGGATSSASLQATTTASVSSSASPAAELLVNESIPITTSADLATYDDIVVKARPSVTAINVDNTNGKIAIEYVQPAKLFGVFPATITGTVTVDAQGTAAVTFPWWAMFYAKDAAAVQTSVTGAVAQSGASFDAQADAQTQLRNEARVIDAVTGALQARAVAEASTSVTATAAGQ
jgi:hypothetical protein